MLAGAMTCSKPDGKAPRLHRPQSVVHGSFEQSLPDLYVGSATNVDHDAFTHFWLHLSEQNVQTRPQGIIECQLWHLYVDVNLFW